MRIGAVFPQLEIGDDPAAIRDWAVEVERAGYRHILAFDHVLGADVRSRPGWRGYTSDDMFHEVFVLFGYLAAVTSLELVTGVLVLPQRQTALVAKQAAQLDVLSGGRFRLGVGVGWNEVEYEALGEAFGDRGVRSEEQVELLRALWAEPSVSFDGRWHRVTGAGISPRPASGRIPVWFGGRAEVLLRRVARIGDGWFPQGAPDENARRRLDLIRGHAAEIGRDPGTIGIEAGLTLAAVPRERWLDHARDWRDLGATHFRVNTMGAGLVGGAAHAAALAEVIEVLEPLAG